MIRLVSSFHIPIRTFARYREGALVGIGLIAEISEADDCDEIRVFPSDHDRVVADTKLVFTREGTFLPSI